MRGAEACVQALTKLLHPEQLKRWVLLAATAGGVKHAGMIAELVGPTLCAAAQVRDGPYDCSTGRMPPRFPAEAEEE
jgi:hypothetical protein